jgi:2,3-bisphosphoglycerate-dependent phosphoglycerate mutase
MKKHQPINMRDLYLVRHGLSQSNLDLSVNRRTPDHAIELAPEGHRQAAEAGKKLADQLARQRDQMQKAFPDSENQIIKVRLMVSPYVRTRQTAEGITTALKAEGIDYSLREALSVREQSFGLFDGVPDDELPKIFPLEYAHYKKHTDFEGEFFAPMPLGESRAMVSDRVRDCFGTILRDMSGDDPVTSMIVVSHGVTIRCFIMSWLHRQWEWCENQPNPDNCSITRIFGTKGNWNCDSFFEGFKHKRANSQDRREDGTIG